MANSVACQKMIATTAVAQVSNTSLGKGHLHTFDRKKFEDRLIRLELVVHGDKYL